MTIKQLSLGCLALFGLTIGLSAIAQDQPDNDGVARVVFITPKDGQGPALEKAFTDYHHWMGDKEGALRYQWYEIVSGDEMGSYVARTGGHNWADFDAKHDYDAAAEAKLNTEMRPLMAHARWVYTVDERDLGMLPENMADYTLFSVTHWYVQPGQMGAFRAGLGKIHAALKAGQFAGHYSIVSVQSGGHGNEVVLVLPYKNFADMAPKQPSFMDVLSQAVGGMEAAGKLLSDFGATYKVGASYLIRYRPDLSDYGDMDN